MKKQILYITEHLCKLLNKEQLACIETASNDSGYILNPNHKDLKSIRTINSPDIILASEQCLVNVLETDDFCPNSNFILFGIHKDELKLEKYKERIKKLRFILGDPPLPLLELILSHTFNFFKNKDSSHISNRFNQQNSFSLTCELQNSKERDEMQQKISQFFKNQIEKNKSNLTIGALAYAKNLADILEEFLMNAIWDANPKYASEDRTKPIQLLENEKVNIFCLFDGINLILSVTDLFGSISDAAIEKYIKFSLGIQVENRINEKGGGAGIGLFMILQKIGVLVFEVEKGKATRATAIARGDQSLKDMQKKSRTLLFYEK